MRVLLDTLAWLLWVSQPQSLTDEARATIADRSNEIFVSVVSIWEIIAKSGSGELSIGGSVTRAISDWLAADGFHVLPIEAGHVIAMCDIRHGDLFDRLLIAQARTRGLTVIGADWTFLSYDVPLITATDTSFRARGRSGARGARSRSSRPRG